MEAEVQKEMLANAKEAAIVKMKVEAKAALMLQRNKKVLEQKTLEVVSDIHYSMINQSLTDFVFAEGKIGGGFAEYIEYAGS